MSKEQLAISNTKVFYKNSPKLSIVQQPDEFGSKMKPFLRSDWLIDREAGVKFVITSLISDQNCTTRSSISTLL